MENTKSLTKSNWLLDIAKGVIFSLVISMVLIIVFAIIIRFINVPDNAIMPINQIIKGVSLLMGSIIALKGTNKGFIKGLLIGFFYSVISYIIFSILSSTLVFGLTTITDLIFNGIIGAVSGIIAVNMGRR